jgi:hypothetical protein
MAGSFDARDPVRAWAEVSLMTLANSTRTIRKGIGA